MLSSFSLGLARVVTKDELTDRTLVNSFSLGLVRNTEKGTVSRVLLDAFSVGLSKGSWDIKIYRHRR